MSDIELGAMKLIKIDSGKDFWSLFDELEDDESDFTNNRVDIIDAYKNGNMYGVDV